MSRAPPRLAPCAAVLAFLVSATGTPSPGVAQQDDLLDPGAAQLQRELRSLQNRGPSPGSGMQLDRARRELLRQGGGVYFTPEQARINRELGRLRRDLEQRAPPPAQKPPALPDEGLPRSYGRNQDDALPSTTRQGLFTAGRLVDRAEAAFRAGRVQQARSDLAAARGFLGDGAGGDAALARLRARIDGLETRLAADGTAEGR
ncbi:hypothetical protein [Benzoatithermus flavus]|jgi:hypothetical protein|uniref:DUF4398 domain-containing protein n=1 Tax=Benzoatithermus flavus TaxID=3108223 RepID=A0ABU8XM11_9PROT